MHVTGIGGSGEGEERDTNITEETADDQHRVYRAHNGEPCSNFLADMRESLVSDPRFSERAMHCTRNTSTT